MVISSRILKERFNDYLIKSKDLNLEKPHFILKGEIIIRIFTQAEKEKVCELYTIYKESITRISQIMDTYPKRIRDILVDNNIEIIQHPRLIDKFLKEDYFEVIDSEKKAYFLGLLFTDGSVVPRKGRDGIQIRLELQKEDEYILKEFQKEIYSERKITHSTRKNKSGSISESSVMVIDSIKMAQDLEKYGIINNKTYLTEKLPEISPEFQSAFLRGLIDGDGSIYINNSFNKKYNKYYKKYVVYFCSHKQSICEDFRNISLNYLSRTNIPKVKKESEAKEVYRITYTKKQDVKELITALYKGSSIHLTRKYNLAKEIFELK